MPDTDATSRRTSRPAQLGSQKTYQTDYLLDAQTIAPGATAAANARLFAGAKEVSVVGINFPLVGSGYNSRSISTTSIC